MATALIADPRAPYGAPPLPPEEALSELWASQRFPEAALVTIAGEPVQVLHPGLRGRGPGPDFRHARIAVAGAVHPGDVELHVRATDFRAHGHHRDHAYDRVVLHVVFHDDIGADTLLASGERVPVVELAPRVSATPARWREPCHDAIERLGPEEVAARLELLGDDRFTLRVAELTSDILRLGAGEALGRALLSGALLSGDRAFAEAVAQAVPWPLLLSVEDPLRPEALLLGVAGLLPERAGSPPAHPHEAALAAAWRELGLAPVSAASFETLRPAAHPARRLAGVARLLARHRGLLQGDAASFAGPPRALVAAWEVAADAYWRSFVAPGRPARKSPGALIGRGRAVELLVNAALPWSAACCELAGDEWGAEAARAAFASLPAPERYGKLSFLEEHLRRGGKRLPLNARRQQGLLSLYKRECTQGGCGTCPLS